jgi:hypothetical protein
MDWIMDWSFDCGQQSKSHKGIEEEKKLSMKQHCRFKKEEDGPMMR